MGYNFIFKQFKIDTPYFLGVNYFITYNFRVIYSFFMQKNKIPLKLKGYNKF